MNYQRGLNRAFFVCCIVWLFFVLVGVPVVLQAQLLKDILSREDQAAKMADLSLMAGDSTKYYDEEVKAQAQEYAKWGSFPYFYKKLWGKEGGVMLSVYLAGPKKSPLPVWLRLILIMSMILPAMILPMSIVEGPGSGWLVMSSLMFIPPGVVYGMLATLRWIIRGFRGFPAHTS